ncbi:hypothetical protein LTR16_012763, partial [Cryomyces antarcticus]
HPPTLAPVSTSLKPHPLEHDLVLLAPLSLPAKSLLRAADPPREAQEQQALGQERGREARGREGQDEDAEVHR